MISEFGHCVVWSLVIVGGEWKPGREEPMAPEMETLGTDDTWTLGSRANEATKCPWMGLSLGIRRSLKVPSVPAPSFPRREWVGVAPILGGNDFVGQFSSRRTKPKSDKSKRQKEDF